MSGPLKLTERNGQTVYCLDGEALRVGEPIDLLLADGYWVTGVFEWSGQAVRWPALRFKLGGDATPYAAESSRTAVVALPPDAVLRRSTK